MSKEVEILVGVAIIVIWVLSLWLIYRYTPRHPKLHVGSIISIDGKHFRLQNYEHASGGVMDELGIRQTQGLMKRKERETLLMELRFQTYDDQILVLEGNNGGYLKMSVLDKDTLEKKSEVLLNEGDMYKLHNGLDMFS